MNCREEFLEVQSIALTQGTSATVTAVPTALENKDRYKLRYCNLQFTDALGNEALLIIVNGTTYPVLTKLGNPVLLGQLRRRELLYLVFSNITATTPAVAPHFTLCNDIYCKCLRTPPVITATGA